MRIEIIGCSGAGKTSLAQNLLVAARLAGRKMDLSSELVAKKFGLGGMRSQTARNLILSLALLPWSIVGVVRHWPLFRFVMCQLWTSTQSTWSKLRLTRSYLRVLGEHSFLRHEGGGKADLLIDEGLFSALQMVAVNPSQPPSREIVERYLAYAPVPDLLIQVGVPAEVAIKRTLSRPDPPLKNASESDLRNFIIHGIQAFTFLSESERLSPVLLRVSGETSPDQAAVSVVQKLFF